MSMHQSGHHLRASRRWITIRNREDLDGSFESWSDRGLGRDSGVGEGNGKNEEESMQPGFPAVNPSSWRRLVGLSLVRGLPATPRRRGLVGIDPARIGRRPTERSGVPYEPAGRRATRTGV
ncbi:MAG: hypothetical protein CMJ34_13085 [Phycisphaerae bacterium]|nr:hypothetical protein [Phycisphaerae bacterium]